MAVGAYAANGVQAVTCDLTFSTILSDWLRRIVKRFVYFDMMFPTMLGVTVSHHIPQDVTEAVRRSLKEHTDRYPARIRAILRGLSDRLKTEQGYISGVQVKHYLDEQLRAAAVA